MSNTITIGHIARAHGLKGDVAVVFYSDHPEQFTSGFRFDGTAGQLTIERVRNGPGGAIVKFLEIEDRDGAELLKGVQLTMDEADRRSLDDGEFWPDQLKGLVVRDAAGANCGTVVDVITGGAQDRLVIDTNGGQSFEVPFVNPLVPTVDLAEGYLVVVALPGLLDTPE